MIEGGGLGTEEDVVEIAAGSRHSLFMTASRSLFACGWNEFGQLGTGTRNSTDTPVLVSMVHAGNKCLSA
jgi:alpha-tubulin suppressor-like RCC1 family protein